MSKIVKEKVKKKINDLKNKARKLKKKAGSVAVPLLIGGASLTAISCGNQSEDQSITDSVTDYEIFEAFKREYSDADYTYASHNYFYASKTSSAEKREKIFEEIYELKERMETIKEKLSVYQKKYDDGFLKACKTGQKKDVVEALKIANLNAVDKDGNTGLMLALQNKNFASAYEISKYLAEQKGVDVNRENKKGVNAIDLIRQNMAMNKAWSPVERRIMEKSENNENNNIRKNGIREDIQVPDSVLQQEYEMCKKREKYLREQLREVKKDKSLVYEVVLDKQKDKKAYEEGIKYLTKRAIEWKEAKKIHDAVQKNVVRGVKDINSGR